MKNISIITHKIAEVIRDMRTLEVINAEYRITLHNANFKDSQFFSGVYISQYVGFSEDNLFFIKKVLEDAFKDTEYSVKVDNHGPCTITVTVVEK